MIRKVFLSFILFFLISCVAPGTKFEDLNQAQIDEAVAIIKNTELAKPVERSRKESVILVEDIIEKITKQGDKNLLLSIIDNNNRRRYIGVKLN